jgi:membrane associated rhomboid family serine protease
VIFPILNGFISWGKAPVTWALMILNFAVLIFTSQMAQKAEDGLDKIMNRHFFLATQGRIYAQYLEDHPHGDYPDFLLEMSRQVQDGSLMHASQLGQLAYRDFNFINSADGLELKSDKVASKLWHERVHEIRELRKQHPSFIYGLNAEDPRLIKWVSYIFVHSGWWHYICNMVCLMIFGAVLEQQIGALGFLIVFLLSGTMAAGVFALMTGVTSSPLVGASGAISGVMALYCVLNWGRPERYFYWLFLPFRGFMGFVYLPAWVALVIFAIPDLSGWLGSLPELGGVAHTAHLGGEFAGMLTGLVLFGLRKFRPVYEPHPTARPNAVAMGKLIPFLPPKALKPAA